jgi:hypothetical protein
LGIIMAPEQIILVVSLHISVRKLCPHVNQGKHCWAHCSRNERAFQQQIGAGT